MRYFLRLSYDGTNYCGWQVQANAPSVQQTINEALQKRLGHEIHSYGCGRTDTGVHAKDFYMHFNAEKEIADEADFLFRLNCVVPENIVISRIIPMPEKAHTRFDATERTYEYYIHFNKSPYINRYSFYQGFYKVDWDVILEATEFLKSIEDFSALCLLSEDFKTNICKISHIGWDVFPSHHFVLKPIDEPAPSKPFLPGYVFNENELLRFTISSNRFLRGMVRKIVGTLLILGKHKMKLNEFKEIVTNKGEFRVHYLAPPNGLFLSKIKYPYFP